MIKSYSLFPKGYSFFSWKAMACKRKTYSFLEGLERFLGPQI